MALDEEQIKQIIKPIEEFLRFINVNESVAPVDKFNASQISFFRNNQSKEKENEGIVLYNDEAQRFKEVTSTLYESIESLDTGKRSKKSIEDLVKNAALDSTYGIIDQSRSTDSESSIEAAIEKLQKGLLSPPRSFEVHVSVQGIEHLKEEFKFGKVVFQPSMPLSEEESETFFDNQLGENFFSSDEKEDIIGCYSQLYNKALKNNVLAKVTVDCNDVNAAHFVAKMIVQETIDIINFFAKHVSPSHSSLYLPGQSDNRRAIDFVFLKREYFYFANAPEYCPPFDFTLFCEHKVKGMDRINSMLSRADNTEFEKLILNAMALCGRAESSVRRADKFLFYVIAMEAILTKRKESGITAKLKERYSALWLSTDSYSRINFEEIKKTVAELYDIRCDIAHEGKYEFTDTQLSTARQYASSMIYQLLFSSRFENVKTQTEFIGLLKENSD